MLGRAIDVVFPRTCAGCGEGPWPFCPRCADELEPLRPPWCRRCGRPAPVDVDRCADCPPAVVDWARSAFAYRGPARRAVHRLKFSGWRGVGEALAAALAALGPPPADAVTWVPLAPPRRAERGFDQARVLARALARELRLPAAAYVRRTKATDPQARRSRVERLEAMVGAFRPVSGRPVPGRVLLVDDVLTTGATAAACRSFSDRGVDRPRGSPDHDVRPRNEPAPILAECSRPGLWLPGDSPR